MPTVTMGACRELHLPEEAVRALRLRKGSKLDVQIAGETVVLVPAGRIPKDQRYFWTEEWQRREREADEAIAAGDVLGPFEDADEAIEALRSAKV
ncbi:MAG: AbrB/MazE/SpoVT family DNA-binding domain-containing protein [Deltaproteobacteria bacterium]|nr:AbrB/MazE/SpoVT family DNA-binding domain-containing protein [Deltaproteobacteria bacterium]